jgi:Rnl2 family RNA ligase
MKEESEKKFVRFSEIENPDFVYKTIDKYVEDFNPSQNQEFWQITEKIHGSNVCISNKYEEGPAFFTRNGNQLPSDYQNVMKQYNWEEYFRKNPDIDFVYGEIAGKKIQKGVDYGERAFYVFDAKDKDGNFKQPIIENIEISGYYRPFQLAPVITYITCTLDEVLKYCYGLIESDTLTQINPIEGNIVEGFVIKCLSRPKLTTYSRFIIKVKHPKFEEKQRERKRPKKQDDFDYSPVEPYVNENRAHSAMSKFPGYKKDQIGDVLREVVNDIKNSMEKDGLEWEKQYCKYINRQISKIVVKGADV